MVVGACCRVVVVGSAGVGRCQQLAVAVYVVALERAVTSGVGYVVDAHHELVV